MDSNEAFEKDDDEFLLDDVEVSIEKLGISESPNHTTSRRRRSSVGSFALKERRTTLESWPDVSTVEDPEHIVRFGFLDYKIASDASIFEKMWCLLTHSEFGMMQLDDDADFDPDPSKCHWNDMVLNAPDKVFLIKSITCVSSKSNSAANFGFEITTDDNQIHIFQASNLGDANAWIAAIDGAKDYLTSRVANGSRRRRRSSLVALKNRFEKSTEIPIHISDESSHHIGLWNVADVGEWIASTSYPSYKNNFTVHKVDGAKLIQFSSADLKKIGVDNVKDQIGLLKEIQMLMSK